LNQSRHKEPRHSRRHSFPPEITDHQRKQLLFERFYGGEHPWASRDLANRYGNGDYVKDREALFANETVDTLFQQAIVQQSK